MSSGNRGEDVAPSAAPPPSALPLPHELTAEWTVRAQLTFARGGEPVQREYSGQDAVHPVRVVYKWCAPCEEHEPEQEKATTATSFRSTNSSATTTYADSAFGSPQASRVAPPMETGAGGVTAQVCGTRCQSTCNIVVSAVADFLPQLETLPTAHNEPFVYHSKVRAQQLRDACSQTSDTEERQRRQRPAYDQRRATTDALMNFANRRQAEEANTYVPPYSPTPTPSSTFKSASMPRIPPLPSTQPTMGSQTTQSHPRLPNLGEKKPRTVHIDVYCTGSEEEEEEEDEEEREQEDDERQADADASNTDTDSSRNEHQHHYELDSNSTPQTVLDNEQMLLRHQRISTTGTLPRRMRTSPQPKQEKQQQQQRQRERERDREQLNLGHAITKCSTAEEVSESKQLLFRKHIGDQRAAKLATLRQKYMRQPSDETQSSSAYPNSSRSTMPRDATCSSVSSVLAGDCVDTSWKDTDELDTASLAPFASLTKSESFEYENSLDRVRIMQKERLWSRQHSMEQPVVGLPLGPSSGSPTLPHRMTTISEVRGNSFQRSDTLPSESDGFSESNLGFNTYPGRQLQQHLQRHRPGFLQFFGPPASPEPPQPQTAPVLTAASGAAAPPGVDPFKRLHPGYRWKSEARDNLSVQAAPGSPSSERSSPQLLSAASTVLRCGSEAPPSTTSATTFGTAVAPSPVPVRRFEISRDSPSLASETSTIVSGYTQEHLEKTRRFGNVVAMRKPGHHVGPTKNPNCHCESCQRWLAERFQLRGRAFSLGERPLLRRAQL